MFAARSSRPTLTTRIKFMLLAALLMLSLGVGMAATPQKVEARHITACHIVTDPTEWRMITGYKADPDFVGGMYCY